MSVQTVGTLNLFLWDRHAYKNNLIRNNFCGLRLYSSFIRKLLSRAYLLLKITSYMSTYYDDIMTFTCHCRLRVDKLYMSESLANRHLSKLNEVIIKMYHSIWEAVYKLLYRYRFLHSFSVSRNHGDFNVKTSERQCEILCRYDENWMNA
jgi:hypothetical protein